MNITRGSGCVPRHGYPETSRQDIVEDLHGHLVADPYRWLEDSADPATEAWSKAQDDLVRLFLDRIPARDAFARRLRELSVGVVTPPAARGERLFMMRRHPTQEHAVLVLLGPADDPVTGGRMLIDPSTLSDDDTITLDGWLPSPDGTLLAYLLSDAGTEESELRVMAVETGEDVDGPIDRCRYSSLAWTSDASGLYYVRRLPPGEVPAGEEAFHRRVRFHRLGTDPAGDDLVFGDGRDATAYYSVDVSHDGRWLLLAEHLGTAPRNDVWIADLAATPGHDRLVPVQEGLDAATYAHVGPDGRLYLHTTLDASRYRLAVTDPERPSPEHWTDLLPESDGVLADWTLTGDAVVAVVARHGVSRVTVHDLRTGAAAGDLPLPGLGVASVTSRPEGGDDVWVGYQDFTTPPQVRHASLTAFTRRSSATPPVAQERHLHARKLCAALQWATSRDPDDAPVLLRREENVGHGGRSISRTVALGADVLAFFTKVIGTNAR